MLYPALRGLGLGLGQALGAPLLSHHLHSKELRLWGATPLRSKQLGDCLQEVRDMQPRCICN